MGYWVLCGARKAFFRLRHTDLPTGGNPQTADFDNDGYDNYSEIFLAGTSPLDFNVGPQNPGGGGSGQEELPDYDPPPGAAYKLNLDIFAPETPPTRIQLALDENFEVLALNGTATQLDGAPHDFPVSLPTGPQGLSIEVRLVALAAEADSRTFTLLNHEISQTVRPAAYQEIETVDVIELTIPADETDSNPATIAPELPGTTPSRSLLPVEVVPDWNRDGMINDEDRGKASDETPFMFWVNDDDDDNPEPELADVPEAGFDGNDMVVNSERDLVDFFPVQLRIEKLLEALPADEHTYRISHPAGAFHFIEMPTVQPDTQRSMGAGSYLADETMAAEAMARPMKDTAGNGSELSAEYLAAVENGLGVLLFESNSATDQCFELIVSKNGGEEMVRVSRALPLELDEVEKMYWRANIRPAAYGQQEIPVVPPDWAKFEQTRKERWFVFCHGYNVSEDRARGWNAEVFKRLHQMGADAKFLGVTWEGNQGQIGGILELLVTVTPDYWHNAYNAFRSSSALAAVVDGLSGGEKVIAGHSLGNMLVSSAICDHGLGSEQYFLLNAAVAREAYSASHVDTDRHLVRHPNWANLETRLWSSDYWTLFPTSDGRRKLTWQGRFSTLAANTNPHNYYSTGEEVLKNGDSTEPSALWDVGIRKELAWVKQEMGKGEFTKKLVTGAKLSNGGWAFNPLWGGNPPAQSEPLKADPFFKPFTEFFDQYGQNPASIHGPNGSAIAAQYPIRSFLLGHDVPAISQPAGSKPINGFAGVDMPANLKTGTWGDWKHSDLKNEPMGHVWQLFSDMVSRGELNDRFTPPPIN